MSVAVDDIRYMSEALQLARHGRFTTQPNPRVGCVIVKDGVVVGTGYHARAGGPHAEVVALKQAGYRAYGATAYVTLEPCAHHGRTPPCANELVIAGLKRVVMASLDANPLVAGKGRQMLEDAGIATACGVLEDDARALNAGFLRRINGGLPWTRVKLAASLDGRTAMASGESKWITGPDARRDVQQWRAMSSAIITGIGTVLADDPLLDCRLPGMASCTPLRVVLDTHARLPITARLARDAARHAVLVATAHPENVPALAGLAPLAVPLRNGGQDGQGPATGLDLAALLALLSERGVQRVLVEAGPTLAEAFAQAGFCDELILLTGPGTAGTGRPALGPALHRYRQQAACIDAYPLGPDQLEICRI